VNRKVEGPSIEAEADAIKVRRPSCSEYPRGVIEKKKSGKLKGSRRKRWRRELRELILRRGGWFGCLFRIEGGRTKGKGV